MNSKIKELLETMIGLVEEMLSTLENIIELVLKGNSGRLNNPPSIEKVKKAYELMQTRIFTLRELFDNVYLFQKPKEYDEKGVAKYFKDHTTLSRLRELKMRFAELTNWGIESTESALRELAEELSIKPAQLIHPLRLAVSGVLTGPGIFELLEYLGKDETLERIEIVLSKYNKEDMTTKIKDKNLEEYVARMEAATEEVKNWSESKKQLLESSLLGTRRPSTYVVGDAKKVILETGCSLFTMHAKEIIELTVVGERLRIAHGESITNVINPSPRNSLCYIIHWNKCRDECIKKNDDVWGICEVEIIPEPDINGNSGMFTAKLVNIPYHHKYYWYLLCTLCEDLYKQDSLLLFFTREEAENYYKENKNEQKTTNQ